MNVKNALHDNCTTSISFLKRMIAENEQANANLHNIPESWMFNRESQRQHNLRGVFKVPPSALPHVQARHLALVDDILTTGATAREAATVLLAAGAARVDVWVLARTPAPGG